MAKTGYERQKAVRDNKRAAGMVRLEKWVWPEVRDKVRAYADRENRRAEKERK